MLYRGICCAAVGFGLLGPALGQEPAKPAVPKVVLIGDSIRLGYAPLVAKQLDGKAVVISPKENDGDRGNVLKHLDDWVIREKPDLVHLNCGLHDLKLSKANKQHQVGLADYEKNLREIVARLKRTGATVVFATTTPIHDQRHAKRGANFDRFEADVERFNKVAVKVMDDAGIPVLDLHELIARAGPEKMLGADGTHFTETGNDRLAEAVAGDVLRKLALRKGRASPEK